MGDVKIEVLHGIGTEGRYANDRLDTGMEIPGTGQRWLDLKLRMKPWLVERLLETLVSTCSVSNTGVLLQVADGKSEGEPADGSSSVDGETATSTWTS